MHEGSYQRFDLSSRTSQCNFPVVPGLKPLCYATHLVLLILYSIRVNHREESHPFLQSPSQAGSNGEKKKIISAKHE